MGLAPNPMNGVLIRREPFGGADTLTGKKPCKDAGGGWRGTCTSRGMPMVADNQHPPEAQKR